MVTEPDQPAESADEVKRRAAKNLAARKRYADKKEAADKKPAEPKAAKKKPVEPTLPTAEELAAKLKDNVNETKDQFVEAAIEPAKKSLATLTELAEIAWDTVGGALTGILSRRRRDD